MEIKAIIFDLGGTLIEYAGTFAVWPDLETPGLKAAFRYLAAQGISLPDFEKFSSSAFQILPRRWQMATGGERNLQLLDFLEENLDACDVENVSYEQLQQAAMRYEQTICAQAVPLEAAQETLAILKGLGYQIGLLSNTMFSGAAHIADLKRFSLDGYFDAMLFSAEAGKWKPSPAPYLDLLNQLDIAPEKSVFVGDDPANDIVGGQKAGLRTVLMRSSERFHLPGSVRPDATIVHLSELPEVLSKWSNEN